MHSPIEQFGIQNIFTFGMIGHAPVALTNSALFMIAASIAITVFLVLSTRSDGLIPGRLQTVTELIYGFVADTIRQTAGKEGMKFFPFVFSIFTFILMLNLLGLIPLAFAVTSHIIVTFGLAMTVISVVIGYGIWRHGLHFLHLFVPSGVPAYVLPLVVPIEVVSFLSRPISLAVRLFANMLAGHIALKIFAGFVGLLIATGTWAIISPLPLLLALALTALEFLVAVLQAYVFTLLTCIYLNDALHPHH